MPTDSPDLSEPERVPPTHEKASHQVDASREKMRKVLKEMDQAVADAEQRQEDRKKRMSERPGLLRATAQGPTRFRQALKMLGER